MRAGILERDGELAVLATVLRDAARGHGSVVLISGEAGIGKSSLVQALRAQLPAEGRLLIGYCDDLATPRTLGPFRDLAGSVGTELSRALGDGGDRDRLLAALYAELDWAEHPAVLAVEDVHWADEATLDALRYLIRRIAVLPAVLVLTYRDDELGRDHGLQGLLGQAARTDRVRRLPLSRLSADAVRRLSADSPVDVDEVFELTAGNPFFVHELLVSARGEAVPPSIADAVLARLRRLDPVAQEMLEQLAVVPAALERWLLDELVAGVAVDATAVLAAAEQGGLLTVSPRRVTFRHELTRRAIAGAAPAARLIALNQRVLAALTGRPGADVARIVHHAAQAGDAAAIAAYGPDAAREAARAGAHREAAAHYRLVLEHADRFTLGERARLLQEYGIECYTLGAADLAVGAQQQAVELTRTLGDPVRLGASLRWLSRMRWWAGQRDAAEQAGLEAVTVLEQAGDHRLLALALSNQSQLHMLAHRSDEAIAYGERAVSLARSVGDAAITSHALTNIGMAQWFRGDPGGQLTMQEALRAALDAGDTEDACRAYVNITWSLLDWFRLDEAERYLAAAMKLAEEDEYLGFLSYMHVERARLALARGEWDAAARYAEPATTGPGPTRCAALTVLAAIQVRRGEPSARDLLGPAWELAVQIGELQRLGPVAAVRAEDAWLRGDLAAVRDVVAPVYAEAERLCDAVHRPELGYWLAVADGALSADGPGTGGEHPYAVLAAGRWREAAGTWAAAGGRYEQALALSASPAPADLLTALALLDELGAKPLATRVRGRLRALGVTPIPRGPLGGTRANPAGLTTRQIDVLRLLVQGHTNAQIAHELVLSVRTVDSHVAAVLAKLGAHDRHDAAARATELGVLADKQPG
jgi:DNA-binding CsgD family transcriptional regulator/tetratricopeptide (TPR) repeat protein